MIWVSSTNYTREKSSGTRSIKKQVDNKPINILRATFEPDSPPRSEEQKDKKLYSAVRVNYMALLILGTQLAPQIAELDAISHIIYSES